MMKQQLITLDLGFKTGCWRDGPKIKSICFYRTRIRFLASITDGLRRPLTPAPENLTHLSWLLGTTTDTPSIQSHRHTLRFCFNRFFKEKGKLYALNFSIYIFTYCKHICTATSASDCHAPLHAGLQMTHFGFGSWV